MNQIIVFFIGEKTLEGRVSNFDTLNPPTPNEMTFFLWVKDGFFLWKKTLEGGVSIFDTLNPPTPNEMRFFYGSKMDFFLWKKNP